MIRVMATDVVNAYKATGLIPVRCVWHSQNPRGGCAIDTLAQALGEGEGEEWAKRLDDRYLQGFLDAWDADEPDLEEDTERNYSMGFWDAVACRRAVTEEFSSITMIETE